MNERLLELTKLMQAKKDNGTLNSYEEGMLEILEVIENEDLDTIDDIIEDYKG